MPMASLKPLRKTAPRTRDQHERDDRPRWPPSSAGGEGFSSEVRGGVGGGERDGDDEIGRGEAEEQSTKSLPCQPGSSRSSIAIEPCPWGLCAATRR